MPQMAALVIPTNIMDNSTKGMGRIPLNIRRFCFLRRFFGDVARLSC